MDFTFMSKTMLFRGCQEKDIKQMAKHLEFKKVCYEKKDVIFGNKSILAIVERGGVFAEAYACIQSEPLMIDVTANDDCEILFISVSKLFEQCSQCDSRNRLIQNLVLISAQKNLQLKILDL